MDITPSIDDAWFTAHLMSAYTDRELAIIKAGSGEAFTPILHFKQWLQRLFISCRLSLGKGTRAFCLPISHSERRHLLLVRAILVDPNTRTVILDVLYLNPEHLKPDHAAPYDALLEQAEVFDLDLDEPVAACWAHFLPAFAERARTTAHTSACNAAVQLQKQSLRIGEDATRRTHLCSCGVDSSLVVDEWKPFAPFFTRLAISPLSASPCFDVMGGSTKPLRRPDEGTGNTTVAGSEGGTVGSCARCGKTNMKIQKCGRCRTVAYCSRECQTVHWKIHKPDCKKPE